MYFHLRHQRLSLHLSLHLYRGIKRTTRKRRKERRKADCPELPWAKYETTHQNPNLVCVLRKMAITGDE